MSAIGASEMHSLHSGVGSPVSELGGGGTHPVARMNSGMSELGGGEVGGRPRTGYAEMDGGQQGQGRYYAGNGGEGRGWVAQNS
jgi:hypothetical protein